MVDNYRFSDSIEQNARCTIRYATTIVEGTNGREFRNINWDKSRRLYTLEITVGTEAFIEVRDAFIAQQGPGYAFKFRDPSDYQLTLESIGIGDGSDAIWPIIKRYTTNYRTITRNILYPDATTLLVYVNGVSTGAYTLSSDGVITFTSPPAASATISVTCEFDTPVRFDEDDFEYIFGVEWREDLGKAQQVKLIEVLDE